MAGINSLLTSYNFGQLGSIYLDKNSVPITPPVGKVIIAITFLLDTSLSALLPQTKLKVDGTVSSDEYGKTISSEGVQFIGTEASHNLTANNETTLEGAGGVAVDSSNVFPKGMTIYGRWRSLTIASAAGLGRGALIAYLGDAE